ncbi:MAG: UTP--glucose-1-phosphate uridylyltransferase [Bryobacterales bacterium]|nr:UTP--glucose-1-phosphate uridylyltransferase [Bryobacterales bacterium]
MTVKKAVITAAGKNQRALPLQTLIDQDGEEKPVLRMLVEQALSAKVEEVGVVTWPGDEERYSQAAGKWAGRVRFLAQAQPLGYGHAVYCAREFTGGEAFLHMVGDHLYAGQEGKSCARQVAELAVAEECAVSAVQPAREALLRQYGAVGGRLVRGRRDVYRVETVLEKPTPTEAEQKLIVPGLRAGHYLCFFGMHVLTPAVMEILEQRLAEERPVTLSSALAELARREQYLAIEASGRRYDIGMRYGLLTAQLAVGLSGQDRAEVLARMVEVLADRESGR